MLSIAVSSRALFHLEDGDKVFAKEGQEAFDEYMRAKEDVPLRPGAVFSLVKKLSALNEVSGKKLVEISLLSRNSPDAAYRISRSIEHYGLKIEQAVFVRGDDRFKYISAIGTPLFLSANSSDVIKAIENGVAAATVIPCERDEHHEGNEIKIAFDGDAVLFSDEADKQFQAHGLEAFEQHERDNANNPLGAGPFKSILAAINEIQAQFPVNECPLKVGLITARSIQSNARVLNTLRAWGIKVDAAMFASGSPKGPWLEAFGADIFFDDSQANIDSAVGFNIASGHVPFGTGHGISTSTLKSDA